MTNRKILYGYQIQYGELAVQPQEAIVVRRAATLYIDGLSYQKIADILNGDGIPFSAEAPLWNKHKVKRLLENSRYTGVDGYPIILENDVFQAAQRNIRQKTAGLMKREKRPALDLKKYLRCGCGGGLCRIAGTKKTLCFKCEVCGKQLAISDDDLLTETTRQMAEHDSSAGESYVPSSEAVRLANAINRGLEHPDKPEDTVSLILRGISARYDCCPSPTESDCRPAEVDLKRFGQTVSYITITDESAIIVHFK